MSTAEAHHQATVAHGRDWPARRASSPARFCRRRAHAADSTANAAPADPRIRGPFPILSTPFTASGAVDFDVLANEARFVDWCGCPGMIWPQSGDSVDLLTTDEKLQGMEVLAKAARGLRTALCLGVQGKDTAEMLIFAKHAEKLAPAAIISRPPDSGKTEDDLRQYWRALAAVAQRPVIIQTTGGVAYKGPVPSVQLLIELAKEFPHFGYVKEEAGPDHRPHARPGRGEAADPPRVQRPRRVRLALRVASWHRRPDHRARGLCGCPHPHLGTAAERLGSRGPAGRLQQVPPHGESGQEHPGRRVARLPALPLEEARRVQEDGLAPLRAQTAPFPRRPSSRS